MKVRKHALALVAPAMLVLGAVGYAVAEQVVVDIGTRHVTVDEFEQLLGAMRGSGSTASTLDTLTPQGREKILSAYVDKKLYALAARDEGIDRRPDVRFWVDEAVDEVLAKKFLEAKIAEVPTADPDLQRFYDAHPDLFRTPIRAKARHILLNTKAEADAALARLKAGAPFDKLAAELSADATTKAKGGDLGWVTPGVMVKPFDEALFALKKGQISPIVRTNFGYHIIEVEDIQQSALPPFDAVKEVVKQKWIAASIQQLRGQLEARHPVSVHAEALQAVK